MPLTAGELYDRLGPFYATLWLVSCVVGLFMLIYWFAHALCALEIWIRGRIDRNSPPSCSGKNDDPDQPHTA
jgi:hypothetical protein